MLPKQFETVFGTIAHGLAKKAEALLVFGLALAAVALAISGVNEWLSCLTPAGLYIGYTWRASRSDKHDQIMARLDLERVERERGARLAQRKQKIIDKSAK